MRSEQFVQHGAWLGGARLGEDFHPGQNHLAGEDERQTLGLEGEERVGEGLTGEDGGREAAIGGPAARSAAGEAPSPPRAAGRRTVTKEFLHLRIQRQYQPADPAKWLAGRPAGRSRNGGARWLAMQSHPASGLWQPLPSPPSHCSALPGLALADDPVYTSEFHRELCTFTASGSNPYFPLWAGHAVLLEGEEEDEGEIVEVSLLITVLDVTELVDGVVTRVVEERESIDGELYEVSRNFFATCRETGDVWYFGEDVDFYEDGVRSSTITAPGARGWTERSPESRCPPCRSSGRGTSRSSPPASRSTSQRSPA